MESQMRSGPCSKSTWRTALTARVPSGPFSQPPIVLISRTASTDPRQGDQTATQLPSCSVAYEQEPDRAPSPPPAMRRTSPRSLPLVRAVPPRRRPPPLAGERSFRCAAPAIRHLQIRRRRPARQVPEPWRPTGRHQRRESEFPPRKLAFHHEGHLHFATHEPKASTLRSLVVD